MDPKSAIQTAFQNLTTKIKPMVTNNENGIINYFLPGANQDNDKKVSAEITQQLWRDFKDVFTRIGCFDGSIFITDYTR